MDARFGTPTRSVRGSGQQPATYSPKSPYMETSGSPSDSMNGDSPGMVRYSPRVSQYMNGVDTPESGRYADTKIDDVTEAATTRTAKNPAYQPYPASQPFIYDEYRRRTDKPVKSFPESNRPAIMSALRGLQEKIRTLELERSEAEANLKSLANETSRYRDILTREQDSNKATQTAVSQHAQELETQLNSAEGRCNLLEKQLDYMRKMVSNAEANQSETAQRSTLLSKQHDDMAQVELRQQLNKLSELEQDHLKLSASQSLAQSKIRELEEKLKEERHHRKMMQEKAAELETAAQTNRILLETSPQVIPKRVKKKKKITTSTTVKKSAGPRRFSDPSDHYRLNLAQIPFVVGKSASPSHNVNANVQKVLSLMKSHNGYLCTKPSSRSKSAGYSHKAYVPSSSSSTTESDLDDLLLQLQDEFGHMSFEHQELSRQIQEADDERMREDLERELDQLVSRMETKGDQIARLKRHKLQIQERRLKKKKSKPRDHIHSARSTSSNGTNAEVEVTTTIKTKGRAGPIKVQPGTISKASLNVLKDMKKLQTTLRKDDLSWDC